MDHELDAWRDSLRHTPELLLQCKDHHWKPTATGAVCTRCGQPVDKDEM